ncbi:BadF/BadG/BcrA/BcrD ATPase family protein [Deinococcus koreensis]|uniref:ATPase n=1 Tax=Deinococcus koreensis TaxID=2054903 RepID=A0A2K3UT67_9DEIO|nr:BadF/BadG/BcrA/BcrD ATPase family protein [Deinococcus koreensis]PNY79726.1 ATPase [Deinococcus koreensis]
MSRSGLSLGLDAGGSATKWALLRGGQVVADGVAPPLTAALLGTPAGEHNLAALVAALPGRPDALHAGMPGLSAGSGRALQVRAVLASAVGLGEPAVGVESDLDLAYRTHLGAGEGILLYAGTGSVAYHVTPAGAVVRAGGYGFKLGDDGGGSDIGRSALRQITATLDRGETPVGLLATEVGALTGGLDWDSLRAYTYADAGAAALARLAPAVGRAADAGDPEAHALLQGAARSLAELARRVQARTGPLPVTATGGAFRISSQFPALLGRELPGATVQYRDHAAAAARSAERLLDQG